MAGVLCRCAPALLATVPGVSPGHSGWLVGAGPQSPCPVCVVNHLPSREHHTDPHGRFWEGDCDPQTVPCEPTQLCPHPETSEARRCLAPLAWPRGDGPAAMVEAWPPPHEVQVQVQWRLRPLSGPSRGSAAEQPCRRAAAPRSVTTLSSPRQQTVSVRSVHPSAGRALGADSSLSLLGSGGWAAGRRPQAPPPAPASRGVGFGIPSPGTRPACLPLLWESWSLK